MKGDILTSFLVDYDLDDLASNDRLLLEELANVMQQLERFNEAIEEELDKEDLDVHKIQKLQKLLSDARKDASSLQDDLKISRKSRSKSQESIPEYIKSIKERAAKFLKERLSYIYCPKCKTLVGTVWLLDYSFGARFRFVCPNCNEAFLVKDSELTERSTRADTLVPTKAAE